MLSTRTTAGNFRVPRPRRRWWTHSEGIQGRFKCLAAGRPDEGRPRRRLPAPHILQTFRLLDAFPASRRSIYIPLSPSGGFCSTCGFCMGRLDTAHSPLPAYPPTSACRCMCWDAHSLVDPCQVKPSPDDELRHGAHIIPRMPFRYQRRTIEFKVSRHSDCSRTSF